MDALSQFDNFWNVIYMYWPYRYLSKVSPNFSLLSKVELVKNPLYVT